MSTTINAVVAGWIRSTLLYGMHSVLLDLSRLPGADEVCRCLVACQSPPTYVVASLSSLGTACPVNRARDLLLARVHPVTQHRNRRARQSCARSGQNRIGSAARSMHSFSAPARVRAFDLLHHACVPPSNTCGGASTSVTAEQDGIARARLPASGRQSEVSVAAGS